MRSLLEPVRGFITLTEGESVLSARGLNAGEACALYGKNALGDAIGLLQTPRADAHGALRVSIKEKGCEELLLASADGVPLLYCGGDQAAFLWLLGRNAARHVQSERDEPLSVEEKQPEQPSEAVLTAIEPKDEPPTPEEGIKEKPLVSAELLREATVRAVEAQPVSRELEYALREQTDGAPTDALPSLRWPEGARQFEPYFERFMPIGMALAENWRCVRVQSKGDRAYILGRRANDDCVDRLLFARRDESGKEYVEGETIRGADGLAYRALYRDAK